VDVLVSSNDVDVVRAPLATFDELRQQGYSCFEIAPIEIPVGQPRIHFPREVLEKKKTDISTVLAAVSDSIVRSTIQGMQNFGTRYYTNANRDSVFRWLRNRFLQTGITDVAFDSFYYNSTWQKNVIATIPGSVYPDVELIVGGHLDSYSSPTTQAPGADDNASGTAAAIEMARAIVATNYQPALTMRFIGFAAEEAGLRGSADYALKASQANRDIRSMQNYDMIGYRDQSQPDRDVYVVWYVGSEPFSNLHSAMARMYTTLNPVLTSSYRSGSDSYSFAQRGYNATFLIERDFSPYYHSPNDLLQYLEIPYATEIIKSGLAMLLTLDMMPPGVNNLRVQDRGNGTSLLARWDSVAVPDLYRYKVYVGTSSGVYTANYLEPSRSRLITGLATGVQCYVGVSIVDLAGREGPITELSATPLVVPLSPLGLTAESIEEGIRLRWRKNLEVDICGYNVYSQRPYDTTFVRLTSSPVVDTAWTDSPLAAGTYRYYATAVDSSLYESTPSDTVSGTPVVVGVGDEGCGFPDVLTLHQNYPNPFNPSTILRYDLPELSHVTLRVFDLLGREVATLVDDTKKAGSYSVAWEPSNLASGVYLAVFQAGAMRQARQMIYVR
jgi:hypothetical protein